MPLTRYQIRNEYALANPEVYSGGDREDPEARLEQVAIAGTVGILRLLGDLAEFGAEIFHSLNEEVMATAARGYGLMARVQQIEAELPFFELEILSKPDVSPLFDNPGIAWHPNFHMEQNFITSRDMPRFLMDSYEECRGPPRLFLLDKFDIAGEGACLKRYSDPSRFKYEPLYRGPRSEDLQEKEKKTSHLSVKIPEATRTHHARLRDIFHKDRSKNADSNDMLHVKLKQRQSGGFPFGLKRGKKFMKRLLTTPSPEHKNSQEAPLDSSPPYLISNNVLGNGNDADSSCSSKTKKTVKNENRPFSCSKVSAREMIDGTRRSSSGTEGVASASMSPSPPATTTPELMLGAEKQAIGKADDFSDTSSDVDEYADAVAVMEPEIERTPKMIHGMDQILETSETPVRSTGVHSRTSFNNGSFSVSDGGSSSINKGSSSFSFSDSLGSVADNAALFIGDGGRNTAPLKEWEETLVEDDKLGICGTRTDEGRFSDPGESSSSSCLTDSNISNQCSDSGEKSFSFQENPVLHDQVYLTDSVADNVDAQITARCTTSITTSCDDGREHNTYFDPKLESNASRDPVNEEESRSVLVDSHIITESHSGGQMMEASQGSTNRLELCAPSTDVGETLCSTESSKEDYKSQGEALGYHDDHLSQGASERDFDGNGFNGHSFQGEAVDEKEKTRVSEQTTGEPKDFEDYATNCIRTEARSLMNCLEATVEGTGNTEHSEAMISNSSTLIDHSEARLSDAQSVQLLSPNHSLPSSLVRTLGQSESAPEHGSGALGEEKTGSPTNHSNEPETSTNADLDSRSSPVEAVAAEGRDSDDSAPQGAGATNAQSCLPPPPSGFLAPDGARIPKSRNPLFDAAGALDRSNLRKVSTQLKNQSDSEARGRDLLLEQIRTKSLTLKPAVVTRAPVNRIQDHNLKVAAILQKANAIRQALVDSDDESETWSDS